MLTHVWDGDESTDEQDSAMPQELCEATIAAFCTKWCLECVGTGRIGLKGGFNKVIYYRASRPRVEISPNGDGLNVFMPRFYQFSHIKNHASEDFGHLKEAMDCVYDAYRKSPPKKELSRSDKRKQATKKLHDLMEMGMNPVKAWDQVRRDMAWCESTMRSYIGEPRFRPLRYYKPKPGKTKTKK
jgi:hypothetical protein